MIYELNFALIFPFIITKCALLSNKLITATAPITAQSPDHDD